MTKSTPLAAVTTAEVVSDDYPNASSPVLYLEIYRGRTSFPCRPVLQSRFLIGAGEECDLRLGGDGMPPLHSIIHADGRDMQLEVICPSPALKVNGQVEQSVRLAGGDLIEIGCFQFIARETDAAAGQPGPETQPEDFPCEPDGDLDSEAFDEQSLDDLTAAELVEMIEQEESLIEQLEAGQRMGADALMHAVRERAGSLQSDVVRLPEREASGQPSDETESAPIRPGRGIKPLIAAAGQLELELLQDLERALAQLSVISQELEQRSKQLSRREVSYADAAELLLDAQQQLATHLESLVEQLPARQTAPTRAIA